ncbi:hypothetical protein Dda_5592 [Drechslerella dactyloides]|uniref:Uncharacterized protein n=1 Tax=Drechslerella dactyloides TaxID=74499 RepID=A0AAD6IWH2_DREDA|nr:hypothetical protein Dda_5592 [Drechslerella dactyloides]
MSMVARAPRIAHLVLDFDQTVTISDTLAILASASPLPDANAVFSALTDAYLKDYAAHSESYPTPTSVQDEAAFLASLRSVEQRSIERVEASGLFKGVTTADIAAAARRVAVRRPTELAALMSQVLRGNYTTCACAPCDANIQSGRVVAGRVSIVSVNWSETFIRHVLLTLSASERTAEADFARVEIYANNLVAESSDGGGVATGKLDRRFGAHGLWTAADKLRILDDILAIHSSLSSNSLPSSPSSSCLQSSRTGPPPPGGSDLASQPAPAAVDTAGTGVENFPPPQPPRSEDNGERGGISLREGYECGWCERGLTVYVGDSATDFAALVLHDRVDRGIVMGCSQRDNGSLLAICRRRGVKVLSRDGIREGDAEGDGEKEGGRGGASHETELQQLAGGDGDGDWDGAPLRPLYRVAGWSELLECLRHPDRWKYSLT